MKCLINFYTLVPSSLQICAFWVEVFHLFSLVAFSEARFSIKMLQQWMQLNIPALFFSRRQSVFLPNILCLGNARLLFKVAG